MTRERLETLLRTNSGRFPHRVRKVPKPVAENRVDWPSECEKLAVELAEYTCRKFAADEKIDLPIPVEAGAVHVVLEQHPLHDRWGTVVLVCAGVRRKDMAPDPGVLRRAAREEMRRILRDSDPREREVPKEFRATLRQQAGLAVRKALGRIAFETARTHPDRYPRFLRHIHVGAGL